VPPRPTLKQLEALAKATLTPVGYFFLPEPPVEQLPLPDFRTFVTRPCRDRARICWPLVYACQERQSWYREFAATAGVEPCPFVGSVTTAALSSRSPIGCARPSISTWTVGTTRPTWTEALRDSIGQAEAAGVLVMCSGVVLNNNGAARSDEFRGFTIADALAPLVFINGADTKAAQTFTLAARTGTPVDRAVRCYGRNHQADAQSRQTERWCNQVAGRVPRGRSQFCAPTTQKSNQLDARSAV